MLRHAALRLGLPPEAFWRLSLAEWRMLTVGGRGALPRAALDDLLARFPDTAP